MTINLRTGEYYPPRREDYCTKIAPVVPDPEAECPLWDRFLARVTDNDTDLQHYLARVVGYWLTGDTKEHALFFLYGTGGNGKSVFIDTISGMMGDYATTAPMETFLSSKWDRHPTEIAGLRGTRLVVADEVDSGRYWNESRIKQLTGGGMVKARFMRQDFFEYKPTFKICVVGNNKPSLRNVDQAIRRRLHLIPFNVTITPEERDLDLEDKLKAEWPGILNWAVAGCTAWQEGGLNPPEAVTSATAEYLSAEDSFAQWIDDCTEDNPTKDDFETAADLFQSWKKFAAEAGEEIGSQKRFANTMQARGYSRTRTGRARGFKGIRLLRQDYTDDPRYGS